MPTVAVIPVRSFRVGKRRLGGVLDEQRRALIGRSLAERVGDVAAEAGMLPLFVTADTEVAEWALHAGFPTVQDSGDGLNQAAATGVEWAVDSGSRWLVLHSDLPLLASRDLAAVDRVISSGMDVIAPSSDGGTSALSAIETIDFAYGQGSFHRHLARLATPTVVVSTGLLHDLDSPADLASARRHDRGRWIDRVIS